MNNRLWLYRPLYLWQFYGFYFRITRRPETLAFRLTYNDDVVRQTPACVNLRPCDEDRAGSLVIETNMIGGIPIGRPGRSWDCMVRTCPGGTQ
jgi:hypothetical protein